jgi:hypothetical protein
MYVKRSDDGKIVAISSTKQAQFTEQLDPDDSEVMEFLASLKAENSSQLGQLRSSDTELARVVEDVINLLTDKGVIQFTELPEAAQEKLLQRKSLRKGMSGLNLVDEDNDDLML